LTHTPPSLIPPIPTNPSKAPYIFPLIGVRKTSHLKSNIEALSLQLTPEDIVEIEKGYDFDVGFPHNFVNRTNSGPPGPENVTTLRLLGYFDYVKGREAIKPHQGELNAQWSG
jgi:hypothetical protein